MQGSLSASERAKLDEIIRSEIDAQSGVYQNSRDEIRRELIVSIDAHPSKEVKALLEQFSKAASGLRAQGYEFQTGYHTNDEVKAVIDSDKHKQVMAFDGETREAKSKLNAIKRQVLMKLYTSKEDNDLIKDMADEVKKVIGETARRTCPGAQMPC